MQKINVVVPELPESISDATVIKWYKKIGDMVNTDDNIIDIETDKVMLEISSPCHGILQSILKKEGDTVISQEILGTIEKINVSQEKQLKKIILEKKDDIENIQKTSTLKKNTSNNLFTKKNKHLSPSLRRLTKIHHKNNIITKNIQKENLIQIAHHTEEIIHHAPQESTSTQNRVRMSRLRQTISERLLHSKNNTAMLTTFNEVNMSSIISLRKKYGAIFEKKHGIRIGFMPFFVKAVVQGLKKFPEINASIDQKDIVYYKTFDISIAISTPRGLITPVLNNADTMNMVEIEKKIQEFSVKALENKISIKELTGGNFTITNGGVFGSLMSTPIINPPQSAILGMHLIQDRAIVVNGKIQISPMMYLALSYDHRLIDGKESIGFLVTIKKILEDFHRLLLNI
ncbi:dihydrolipoyllysine-residue succinyltransferase [Buchnera aphidicola (Hyadaphis tataricae)]|uniref:Dihydrolipoyllysine-residue succinyltransferase n=1 Tax=Buchnera aphidicola (Hyadaphis tataricae) TaxID=1241859 RepID=A0A4D6XUR3_9GAMM|nr:dihydrolipoyllysine-residue succinyltransferase [Buchnera aphidicola]QCI21602.1 dihydrolipoyllysine-residue succinyltransferase [Buchnera aphidicola (Hyadaphis tataricae)]